jgi:hypothetical protein
MNEIEYKFAKTKQEKEIEKMAVETLRLTSLGPELWSDDGEYGTNIPELILGINSLIESAKQKGYEEGLKYAYDTETQIHQAHKDAKQSLIEEAIEKIEKNCYGRKHCGTKNAEIIYDMAIDDVINLLKGLGK